MNPIEAQLTRVIWETDLSGMPFWKAWGMRALQIGYAIANDFRDGQLSLRATGLVYTTLLSLVPLLAVSFSVLKGFGVHNQFEPLMLRLLAPLGDKANEVTTGILGFVDNVEVGVLGGVGVAVLFYTVVSLVQRIESSLNYTWHTTQTRSIGQRFSDYLSVILVGPVLMFAAISASASLSSNTIVQALSGYPVFNFLFRSVGELLPYSLVAAAFTFVYAFVPNTKVQIRAAVVGAIVAALLWEGVGAFFSLLVATSAKYSAIYSSFATPILFMLWMYLGWLVLLVGASIAFYVQHPEHLRPSREKEGLSIRLREKLALAAMARIANSYREGDEPWTLDRLALVLAVPGDVVGEVLHMLEAKGLLVQTAERDTGWLPHQALDEIKLADLLTAVRRAEEGPYLNAERVPAGAVVDQILEELEAARRERLGDRSVMDLAPPPRS